MGRGGDQELTEMGVPREDVGNLLPVYPVSPGVLAAQGDAIADRSSGFVALRDDVAARHGVAVDATGGLLVAPMQQAARPTVESPTSRTNAVDRCQQ